MPSCSPTYKVLFPTSQSSPFPRKIHQPATMAWHGGTEAHLRTLHIDGALLKLDPEEEAFFKAETGIQDTEALKKHIVEVHEEAYKVCIPLRLPVDIESGLKWGHFALRLGPPVSLHSRVWAGEAPGFQDACVPADHWVVEEPTGRNISGGRMLPYGPAHILLSILIV